MKIVLDNETTTFNKGHPFDPRNFLVSYARKCDNDSTVFCYYTDPGFISELHSCIYSANELVGFNIKFDLHWLTNYNVYLPISCRIWDCSLAEFIISGQTARFISLNEVLESYGEPRKPDLVADYWARGISTENIPIEILEEYNIYDVDGTARLQQLQQELMSPEQIALVYLMGEDLKALQHAEYAGIKFDISAAAIKLKELSESLYSLHSQLVGYLPDKIPNPPGFNFDSGDQLSAFLYGGTIVYDYAISYEAVYKSGPTKGEAYTRNSWHRQEVIFPRIFVPVEGSEVKKTLALPPEQTHFYQTDEPTLLQLKAKTKIQKSILELLQKRAELTKVKEMIESIQNKSLEMNWQDNYIHGQFNQNVVVTGRLSSSGPNLQNTPEEVDELLVSRYDT